jgi:hypothetical protein
LRCKKGNTGLTGGVLKAQFLGQFCQIEPINLADATITPVNVHPPKLDSRPQFEENNMTSILTVALIVTTGALAKDMPETSLPKTYDWPEAATPYVGDPTDAAPRVVVLSQDMWGDALTSEGLRHAKAIELVTQTAPMS